MQNRRNVQVGSLDNQQKPREGKTEVQFTVTTKSWIRNREKRVSEIVVRELKRAKPGEWGCVQAREEWSTEEETHRCPGHFWICKFGTVPGIMSCVEKKFELQDHKWEEYRGTRFYRTTWCQLFSKCWGPCDIRRKPPATDTFFHKRHTQGKLLEV